MNLPLFLFLSSFSSFPLFLLFILLTHRNTEPTINEITTNNTEIMIPHVTYFLQSKNQYFQSENFSQELIWFSFKRY